jgi:cytochrome c oxidase subunit 6a
MAMGARRTPTMAMGTRRSVTTVPRLGTEAEMQSEAVAQIRARIAYQKEIMAANPHKSHSEEWNELWLWIKISLFICGPGCILGVTKDLLFEVHHHRPEENLPEYMGIRKKEFPWECDQCDIFHLECWKKCRAEKEKA